MVSSRVYGRFITKRLVLKMKKLIILMAYKQVYGRNGLKMVKKEEKEILKMVKGTVPGQHGIKMATKNS